uniref:Uncharacterized protein n=1 Tax=Anguilla anguilla TaxID=7936 RepID=A0A0E9TDM0_ANGAN
MSINLYQSDGKRTF